jgi:hypothetical protein
VSNTTEANKILAMMNRSSRHQDRQIQSNSDQKFFLKISGDQQRWLQPLRGDILIPPALLVVADIKFLLFLAAKRLGFAKYKPKKRGGLK